MHTLKLLSTIILICTVTATVDKDLLNKTIEQATQNSWNLLRNNEWSFPSFLGSSFMSEYYFELLALNLTSQTKFNSTIFTQLLWDT
jgi:hypothetical protein